MKNKKYIFYIITSIIISIFLLSGCSVKVETITVEAIPILNVGDTYKLKYTIKPDNVTDETVTFESSDKKIATIDSKGLIKAIAPGEVEISVLPNDEERISTPDTKTGAKIKITVIQPVKSVNCKLELIIAAGKSEGINAEVLPKNASDKTLAYKSFDESIATVDNNGKITGRKKGNAVITATSVNGIIAECKVTVKQPVTGIKLDKTSLELEVYQTATIKSTLSPKGADLNTKVTFSSSDKNVATINSKGEITAVYEGETTIWATVKDVDGKSITAKCVVSVYEPYVPEPVYDDPIYDETESADNNSNKTNDDYEELNEPIIPPFEPTYISGCSTCGSSIGPWSSRCPYCRE